MWTSDHQKAAIQCCYEVAADLVKRGHYLSAQQLGFDAFSVANNEIALRDRLGYSDLTDAEIEREVRRVYARAEGREIVEKRTSIQVRYTSMNGDTFVEADHCSMHKYPQEEAASVTVKKLRESGYKDARRINVTITRCRIVRDSVAKK